LKFYSEEKLVSDAMTSLQTYLNGQLIDLKENLKNYTAYQKAIEFIATEKRAVNTQSLAAMK
jgi:hypothetical protein